MTIKPLLFLICSLPVSLAFATIPATTRLALQPSCFKSVVELLDNPSPVRTIAQGRCQNTALHVSFSPDDEKQLMETTTTESISQEADNVAMESWESESKLVELVLLATWGVAISIFILMNNFVGPWPAEFMHSIPERVNFVLHMVGGMLFGGGVILTTAIEWLVAKNGNSPVLQFWFDKVPLLDALIVLPALTVAMMSGTGLTIAHYGGLNVAPVHISIVFYTLVLFALWWAFTDLTTQGKALMAVNEWAASQASPDESRRKPVPEVVHQRFISNIVSCLFIFLLYAEMVFKPGTLVLKDLF
jgi:hypothetical protein